MRKLVPFTESPVLKKYAKNGTIYRLSCLIPTANMLSLIYHIKSLRHRRRYCQPAAVDDRKNKICRILKMLYGVPPCNPRGGALSMTDDRRPMDDRPPKAGKLRSDVGGQKLGERK